MSKKFRDFLFFFFVFVFIIGTILLSIYASGYKFNLTWPLEFNRLLVKTGMLVLDSNPKGAVIYLDGKAQPSTAWRPWRKKYLTTPAKIKNLIPGEYEIIVEKDGYWPFKTSLRINSGLTTFYEHINLFKSDNPSIKAVSDLSTTKELISLSPNGSFLYLANSAKIINLDKEEERFLLNDYKNLLKTSNNDAPIFWEDNNTILVSGIFFSSNKKNDNDFVSLIGPEAYDWKFDKDNERLFYKTQNNLSYINLNQKQATTILRDLAITDYLPSNKSIFLINPEDKNTFLQEYSYEDKSFVQQLKLPSNGDYVFAEEQNKYLSVYDQKNKSLYILSRDNLSQGFKKLENVKDWQWNLEEGVFFISDWELQYFDIRENRFDLLARLGINLENLLINKKNDYLILSSDQEILVYDLQTSYMTTILETEKISSPVLDAEKDLLYFWGKLGDQQGVYRISVK